MLDFLVQLSTEEYFAFQATNIAFSVAKQELAGYKAVFGELATPVFGETATPGTSGVAAVRREPPQKARRRADPSPSSDSASASASASAAASAAGSASSSEEDSEEDSEEESSSTESSSSDDTDSDEVSHPSPLLFHTLVVSSLSPLFIFPTCCLLFQAQAKRGRRTSGRERSSGAGSQGKGGAAPRASGKDWETLFKGRQDTAWESAEDQAGELDYYGDVVDLTAAISSGGGKIESMEIA